MRCEVLKQTSRKMWAKAKQAGAKSLTCRLLQPPTATRSTPDAPIPDASVDVLPRLLAKAFPTGAIGVHWFRLCWVIASQGSLPHLPLAEE